MAHPHVEDGGENLWMWRVAANILNKQLQTADKGWSSSLGVGCGANNCKKKAWYKMPQRALELDRFFG
jgi:hypothetical protein